MSELQHQFKLEIGLPTVSSLIFTCDCDRREGRQAGEAVSDGKFDCALCSGQLESDLGQSDTLHRMEIDRFKDPTNSKPEVLVGGKLPHEMALRERSCRITTAKLAATGSPPTS